jgi:small membrane protein
MIVNELKKTSFTITKINSINMGIKIILVLPLLFIIFFLLKNIQNNTLYKSLLTLVAALGIFLVIFPDLTTVFANKLNVGRGTDLLLYLFIIMFFIVSMMLYSKMRKIEATQTSIIRHLSIQNALKTTVKDENFS